MVRSVAVLFAFFLALFAVYQFSQTPIQSAETAQVARQPLAVAPPPAPVLKGEPVRSSEIRQPLPRKQTIAHQPPAKKTRQKPMRKDAAGFKLQDPPKLVPVAVGSAAQTQTVSDRKERNFSNPMKERWIDDLSGQRVPLAMDKFRKEERCVQGANCERLAAPRDISVVGVVVDSEAVQNKNKPLVEGELKRGHYQSHTPAVYVK